MENHSLAYRVTGIAIKSGQLKPQRVELEKDQKISWHMLNVTVIIHWSSSPSSHAQGHPVLS